MAKLFAYFLFKGESKLPTSDLCDAFAVRARALWDHCVMSLSARETSQICLSIHGPFPSDIVDMFWK